MDKNAVDHVNISRAVYRFIADPANAEKGERAVRNMRENPPVTTQVLRSMSAAHQKKFKAALDGFWALGHRL